MQTHTVDSTQTQTTLDTPEENKVTLVDRKGIDIANSYTRLGRKYFPILSQLEEVHAYRNCKADILSAAQIQILKYALSPAKLEKSGFLQLCQGFEILNKAERLDAGLSSENVSVRTFGSISLTLPTDNEGK
jgi:hypothetical protein